MTIHDTPDLAVGLIVAMRCDEFFDLALHSGLEIRRFREGGDVSPRRMTIMSLSRAIQVLPESCRGCPFMERFEDAHATSGVCGYCHEPQRLTGLGALPRPGSLDHVLEPDLAA